MENAPKYASIQVREDIKDDLKKFCIERGLVISRTVEIMIQYYLTGSVKL